jgi:hypothetical protein
MPLGTTNIKLSDIRGETSAFVGTNDSFYDYNASSWAQGPAPGDNTFSIWGSGVRAAIAQNILYTPTNNGSLWLVLQLILNLVFIKTIMVILTNQIILLSYMLKTTYHLHLDLTHQIILILMVS